MNRLGKGRDYVAIVEACNRVVESDEEWLAQVFESARPILDFGAGIGLSVVQQGATGRTVTLSDGVGRMSDILRPSWPIIEQLDDATYHAFFYPAAPVVMASALVSGFAQPVQQAYAALMKVANARDLLGMLGYPAPGWAFAMFVGVEGKPPSALQYGTLRRLRLHIEASLRLRLFSTFEPVAVIRPDGTLLHIETSALQRSSCEPLVEQARVIERVRSARGRAEPHRALAVWRALVAGYWSLVERVDSDGQRHYLAFENAPHVVAYHALTELEATVLEETLRGKVGKEVAYANGLSSPRVSEALKQAAEKLGFADRAALLRVSARLYDKAPVLQSASLTAAEHEVLSLVKEGRGNDQIAKMRGTSSNTVKNQIASLLRKTGARSRRVLRVGDVQAASTARSGQPARTDRAR